MNQAALNFPPASRASDPATSRQAEAKITHSGQRQSQADMVAELVKRYPGRTTAELALLGPFDRYQVARRMADLIAVGRVTRGTPRRCETNGTNAHTHYIAQQEAAA